MIRLIVLMSALMFSVASFAQDFVMNGKTIIRGGYNFFTEQPVADLSMLGSLNRLSVKIEIGCTQIPLPEFQENLSHFYFSPSAGVMVGDKYNVYLMVGMMPWIGYTEQDGSRVFSDDIWQPKFETGIFLPIRSVLVLNVEAVYMWPDSFNERKFQNFTLRMGVALNL